MQNNESKAAEFDWNLTSFEGARREQLRRGGHRLRHAAHRGLRRHRQQVPARRAGHGLRRRQSRRARGRGRRDPLGVPRSQGLPGAAGRPRHAVHAIGADLLCAGCGAGRVLRRRPGRRPPGCPIAGRSKPYRLPFISQ